MSIVTAAVIQARMDSKRLPGKSLEKIYKDFSLIELVILRVKKASTLEKVILATSENSDCNHLAEMAEKLGVGLVRGNEEDVQSRFIKASEQFDIENIVRICADNPLVSFEAIDMLVNFFRENPKLDYAENNSFQSRFPDSFGAEIVKSSVLKKIEPLSSPEQKEHVIDYILDNLEDFSTSSLTAPDEFQSPDIKLDIDTPEDLEKMRTFCSNLPENSAPFWTMAEILKHLESLSG